ncbi:hypothetical protein BKI52_39985 [marine bacterium AO1-C]|nr:hypothetical protein BKI52_39985 [marine bacterium AO1-C]
MATIMNHSTQEQVYLHYLHTFGRGKTNNTQIKIADVSTDHAKIYWQDQQWFITDRSRNGTLVNNRFLNNATRTLTQGDIIKFGQEQATEWQVIDLSPPLNYLQSLYSGKKLVLANTYYALPNEESPTLELLQTDAGWALENEGNTYLLTDKQTLNLQGEKWVFIENEQAEDTIDYQEIKNKADFRFTLSADQEKVNVKIRVGDCEMDLGNKTYNQVLFILAQQRQKDIQAGMPLKDQGWMRVDQLTNKLSKEEFREIDQYNLNTRIRRIRQDLLRLPPYGKQFVGIIERNRGGLRFNHAKIYIHY